MEKAKKEKKAKCNNLNYKLAAFYGCTFGEMGLILLSFLVLEIPLMLLLASLLNPYLHGFLGSFLVVFLVSFLMTYFVLVRVAAKAIGKIRKGKQPGYLTLKMKYYLNNKLGISIPYVIRNGKWISRRSI